MASFCDPIILWFVFSKEPSMGTVLCMFETNTPRTLKKGFFLASASTLPGLVVRTEMGGVAALVLQLLSATRSFRADSRIELIGYTLRRGA